MTGSVISKAPGERFVVALRWLARISSSFSIGLLSLFLFGGHEAMVPTLREAIAMAFFPFGVVAGMAIGWKSELRGGLVALISLALFYVVMLVIGERAPTGPWFAFFTLPGVLFLICGLLSGKR